jgi:hypothetical protein
MAEVYWTIASAWARLGTLGPALEALESAVRTGWRDAAWMENDPEFERLRGGAAFRRLVGSVRRWPRVDFDDCGDSKAADA